MTTTTGDDNSDDAEPRTGTKTGRMTKRYVTDCGHTKVSIGFEPNYFTYIFPGIIHCD
jgi:hypothetical protein